MTQLELAVKSKGKLSTATISKAETDPSYNPKLTTFIKFYKIMDVSFEDIVATLEGNADFEVIRRDNLFGDKEL
ncbi:XRE family transcriptional regulator [Leuconostoc sp. JNUCC 76]